MNDQVTTEPAEAGDELQTLMQHMESLWLTHLERLPELSPEQIDEFQQDAARLRKLSHELRQQHEQWKVEQQAQTEQLRQDKSLLVTAWERLESEQRRLLAEKELLRRSADRTTETALVSGERVGENNTAAQPAETRPAASSLAWSQLQQLRREFSNQNRALG